MSDDNELTTCRCVFSSLWFCYIPLCVWCVGVVCFQFQLLRIYVAYSWHVPHMFYVHCAGSPAIGVHAFE